MKVDCFKLSEDRELAFSESWDAEGHDLNAPGLTYIGPLKVEAFARRDSGIAVVRVLIEAETRLNCSRCFKEFNKPFKKEFRLVYSLDLSEKVIFLDDNIREELVLDYPHKIFCREDCRGLCIKCGADLNEGECACKHD